MIRNRTNAALLVLGTCFLLFLAPHLGAQVYFEYDLSGNLVMQTAAVPTGPPVFQELGPQYAGAYSNGLLTVSVPVTGAGPFTYQWLFNGVALSGATSDTYLLTNATASNLGNYQLVATGSGGTVTSAVVNVSFFDPSGNGLPVAWELAYFGTNGVNPNADPDADGVSNYQEYLDGTNPTNHNSVMPRLWIADVPGGTVSVVPLKAEYQWGDTVQVTATPNPGWSFYGWSGSLLVYGTASLTVVMNNSVLLTPSYSGPVLTWGDDNSGQGDLPSSLGPVAAIAAGFDSSLALQTNGTVVAWGYNFEGQCTVPEGLSNVVAIAAGYDHSLALVSNGTVVAWGDDTYGECTVPAGLSNVVAVAGGDGFSLALQANGTVAGWGDNFYGAVSVPAGLANVVAIAAGYEHGLALRGDGTLAAWGLNQEGQAAVPAGLDNVVAIAAGDRFSLALRGDGTVVGWGLNTSGQATVPEGWSLTNVVAIAAGGNFSLALRGDGAVSAWGDNGWWQVYDAPLYADNITAIAAGGYYGLALFSNGAPAIVSPPVHNYAYSGTTVLLNAGVAGAPPLSYQWSLDGTDLDGATNATLALTNVEPGDSGVYSWVATNLLGAVSNVASVLTVSNSAPIVLIQPGNWASPLGSNATFSVTVDGSPPFAYQWQFGGTNIAGATQSTLSLTNVAAGNWGSYGVVVSNAFGTTFSTSATLAQVTSLVVAWGDNYSGETNIPPGLGDVVAIAAGDGFCLALQANGTVAAWGNDRYGQTDIPATLSNVTAIAAGDDFSLMLKKDSTVVALGDDSWGQVDVPAGLSNVVGIAAGDDFSLALRADGTVVGWGDDSLSQVDVPAGLSNVVAISAGWYFSLALKADGTVVAWGDTNGPINVAEGLSGVAAIAAGEDTAMASQSNGTVVVLQSYNYQVPTPASVTNAVAVAIGEDFLLALLANGTVVAWNYSGVLQTNSVPTGLTNVVAIAANDASTLAMAIVRGGSVVPSNNLVLGSPTWLANRQFQFTVSGGATGQGYTMLASTNLFNWITLTNGSITNSPFLFSDPAASNYPRRFYRVTTP